MTELSPDDRPLVRAFLADRDERAFRRLYARHTPRLYRFALRICGGDVRVAEEIVQDTWISAASGLDRFRWESSLATWLAGIAVNACRQVVRRETRGPHRVELHENIESPAPPGPERMDLERALAALAERYRMVVVLHDAEGYTHAEIGRMLGIDAGTSKSQLFRARRRLRELLDPALAEQETGND